jgi:phosphoglycolate phosphatase-like HAD superfamily hydrolase
MSVQAALFDLDGTLVDLRAAYVRAHQRTAREVLSIELEEQRILELMSTGSPIRTHMALLDEGAADRLVEIFVMRYREEREGLVRPFPGVKRMLRDLRRRGLLLGVVTSKLREDASVELAASGLGKYVGVLIAFEDTDEHKPAAAPQLAALRRLGVATGVGIGDLPSDVVSARAAGLRALGVGWGYGTPALLTAAGAEGVCGTAEELHDVLVELLDAGLSSRIPQPTAADGHPSSVQAATKK